MNQPARRALLRGALLAPVGLSLAGMSTCQQAGQIVTTVQTDLDKANSVLTALDSLLAPIQSVLSAAGGAGQAVLTEVQNDIAAAQAAVAALASGTAANTGNLWVTFANAIAALPAALAAYLPAMPGWVGLAVSLLPTAIQAIQAVVAVFTPAMTRASRMSAATAIMTPAQALAYLRSIPAIAAAR
jgi:hypothetical protein